MRWLKSFAGRRRWLRRTARKIMKCTANHQKGDKVAMWYVRQS